MTKELIHAGINPKNFLETPPDIFFNVKFKIEDFEYFHFKYQISDKDNNIKSFRYNLLTKKSKFILVQKNEEKVKTEEANSEEIILTEGKEKSTKLRRREVNQIIEYDPLHDKIQSRLKWLLKREYQTVLYESNRVDLKAKADNNSWHFFEIKTDEPSLSIRKALGQLFEYAYFPNKDNASRLIVVSIYEPDDKVKQYLQSIRARFKIPIFYRYFDIDTETISQEY